MQGVQAITHAKRDQNFFIFDFVISNKVMHVVYLPKLAKVIMIQGNEQPTHLICKNK